MFNYLTYEKLLKRNIEEKEKKERDLNLNKERKSK